MSLVHGQTATDILTPLLVDATGRPLVVVDSIGTVTVTGSVAADTELPAAAALADGAANPTAPTVGSGLLGFNDTTWDRWRNNAPVTPLASAVRAVSTQSATFTNYNARGIWLVLDITAVPGVQTVTLSIYAGSPLVGISQQLLAGVAQAAIGRTGYMLYPGVAAAALGVTAVAGYALPRTWAVVINHSGAGNFTYSVSGYYME